VHSQLTQLNLLPERRPATSNDIVTDTRCSAKGGGEPWVGSGRRRAEGPNRPMYLFSMTSTCSCRRRTIDNAQHKLQLTPAGARACTTKKHTLPESVAVHGCQQQEWQCGHYCWPPPALTCWPHSKPVSTHICRDGDSVGAGRGQSLAVMRYRVALQYFRFMNFIMTLSTRYSGRLAAVLEDTTLLSVRNETCFELAGSFGQSFNGPCMDAHARTTARRNRQWIQLKTN
jgi:hypothetical protein